MKKFGSKDTMRMDSIINKSNGDYMTQILHCYNMACAITDPGKAMARGFAAQESFGEHSPCAAVFFERAYDLGGKDVIPIASVNPWENSEQGIEAEYSNIPENEQPMSRRSSFNSIKNVIMPKRKTSISPLTFLGKLNLIKASSPLIDLHKYPYGTIEVWEAEEGKYRLIYTSHYESTFYIGEERQFKYTSEVAGNKSEKVVTWNLIDYIETKFVSNLAPLYGKSISIFSYE